MRAHAVGLEHDLRIPVVRGHQADSPAPSRRSRATRPRQRSTASTAATHRGDRARVADHVRVREVDDREAVAAPDLARRTAPRARPPTSRASGRSSATSRGDGTRIRVSPSHSRSSPPFRKYVTCAYFSVSAACSWRAPALESTSASVFRDLLLVERDREREVVAVARHRRQVDAGLEQPLRELPRAVRPEVEEDRRVRRRIEAGPPVEDDGLDELVGHPALVARLDGCDRVVGRASPSPVRGSRRARGPSSPSAVAVHRVVAAADRGDRARREARRGRSRPRAGRRRARP